MTILERLTILFVLVSLITASATLAVAYYGPEAIVAKVLNYTAVSSSVSLAATAFPTPAVDIEYQPAPMAPIFTEPSERFIRPFTTAKKELLESGVEFIEVNFSTKQIHHFRPNGTVGTTSIMAVGDPQGWGGTPAGLYSVLDKNERAFSASAEAYMPQAVHLYGKYFIHGEPYYASGEKIVSDISGGCIRLSDTDAPTFFNKVSKGLPALVVDLDYDDNFKYEASRTRPTPVLTAKSYLVADLDSGEILIDKDSTTIRPIASITKLMTAAVVAEHVDLRRNILVTDTMLERGFGETSGLLAGANYRIVELFYPLLTESSNDAAEVLSEFLGRGHTLTLMNEKAKHLFMNSTTYSDPSGLEDGNQSSAQDLYLLGRYLANNRRPLLDITRGRKVTSFGQVSFALASLRNKNNFQTEPGFIGGKSGFTDVAQNTGLFMFKVKTENGEERRLGVVVLGSEALKGDVDKLRDYTSEIYNLDFD